MPAHGVPLRVLYGDHNKGFADRVEPWGGFVGPWSIFDPRSQEPLCEDGAFAAGAG